MLFFQNAKTLKVEGLAFEVKKIVKSKSGSTLDDFVNESDVLIKQIDVGIIQPILKPAEEKQEETSPRNPLLVQPSRPIIQPNPYYDNSRNPIRDPLWDIGRGDLDPLGRGGGGMLFQPDLGFRPGGFGPLGPLPGPFG